MPAIKLENKSARILLISLGGGEVVTVPPSDPTTGQGAVVLQMDDAEKERFDKALATPAVQEWVDAEELVVSDGPADAKPKDKPLPHSTERKPRHFFGGDKEKGEP